MHNGNDALFYRVQYFSCKSKIEQIGNINLKIGDLFILKRQFLLNLNTHLQVMLNIESTLDSLRQLTCIGHDELLNYELITDNIRYPCDPCQNRLQVDWWHMGLHSTASSICQQNKGETTPWDYTGYSLKTQSPARMDQST